MTFLISLISYWTVFWTFWTFTDCLHSYKFYPDKGFLICRYWLFHLMCFLADWPGSNWRRKTVHHASGPGCRFLLWLGTQSDPGNTFFIGWTCYCCRQQPEIVPNHPRWDIAALKCGGLNRVKCGKPHWFRGHFSSVRSSPGI